MSGRSHSLAASGALVARVSLPLSGPAGRFDLEAELVIPQGAFVVLTGPSGAGKTTLLRLIAGLARPADGFVSMDAAVWCDTAAGISLPVRRRSLGFVFQDYALFPNMTARDNIGFALHGLPRRERRARAEALLATVGLAGLGDAWPAQMSGGQKQRLALVRAVARAPRLLLLDEPLSALDPEMRAALQRELRALHEGFGATTLMISHDPAEAAALADSVIHLSGGKLRAG